MRVKIVLAIVISAVVPLLAFSQAAESKDAGFTLALSRHMRSGIPPGVVVFLVTLTNTSQKMIYENACNAFGRLYKLSVVYNGDLLDEPDGMRMAREAREHGDCNGSVRDRKLNPGESWGDTMEYQTKAPGTYEFTVEEEAFPRDQGKDVIVRSNTVTVIMPEPSSSSEGSSRNNQLAAKTTPAFSLTLSEGSRDYRTASWQTKLVVRFANISSRWIVEDSCAKYSGFYKFSVILNGVPIEETDEQRKRRKALQDGDCNFGPMNRPKILQPGEFEDYSEYYDTREPGTYRFTVEEETFPRHPDEGLTIKSNTITVVIPKPKSD